MKCLSSVGSLSITLFLFLLPAIKINAQSVKIGNQTWMVGNLDVSTFRNGDLIKEAATKEEWESAGQESIPAWCYADNNSANGKKYGKLYNWFAVNDPRGLAPKGWHVPGDAEWSTLTNYLGGNESVGSKLKATAGWPQYYNGTNASGFTALPGGYCDYAGYFENVNATAYFWSATESSSEDFYAYYRHIRSGTLDREESGTPEGNGLSVRCIRD